MHYLLTIYTDESVLADMTPEEGAAETARWGAYTTEAATAGKLLGGNGLQPTSTATTVRLVDDERVLTDGPFAETKEQLGGYYLLDCTDLDEALEWAAKIPSLTRGGSVEVRPVMTYDEDNDPTVPAGQASQA
jgi:hypothetical protein